MDERIGRLLADVAEGWEHGDPGRAAGAFTAEATYLNRAAGVLLRGRDELYAFFRGDGPSPRPMRMTWHRVGVTDPGTAALGEYTFEIPGELTTHGVAVVEVTEGLIGHWHEYSFGTDLSFEDYVRPEWTRTGVEQR